MQKTEKESSTRNEDLNILNHLTLKPQGTPKKKFTEAAMVDHRLPKIAIDIWKTKVELA